jgi:hypothetical protein
MLSATPPPPDALQKGLKHSSGIVLKIWNRFGRGYRSARLLWDEGVVGGEVECLIVWVEVR